MIPSLNAQLIPIYPDGTNWDQVVKVHLPYTCDCCRKIVSPKAFGVHDEYWSKDMNPRIINVGGIKYYGCSTECARILFDIHHKYAQLMKG